MVVADRVGLTVGSRMGGFSIAGRMLSAEEMSPLASGETLVKMLVALISGQSFSWKRTMLRRTLLKMITFVMCVLLWTTAASACPNCKAANETDSNLPRAYMYSILFMIGMPMTIFTGFGISFYRMAHREQESLVVADDSNSSASD